MNLVSAKMPNQLCDNNADIPSRSDVTIIKDQTSKTITINGTTTSALSWNVGSRHEPIVGGHKFLLIGNKYDLVSNTVRLIAWANNARNQRGIDYGVGRIFLTETTDTTLTIYIHIDSGITLTNLVFQPMLIDLTELYGAGNEPSTVAQFRADYPLDYYPYSATSYTELLKQNGKLVSTDISQMLPQGIGCVDLGSYTWTKLANGWFRCTIDDIEMPTTTTTPSSLVCSKYSNDTYNNIYGGYNDKAMSIATNTKLFNVRDSAYTDATAFKTAMAGVLLFYKKATT